MDNLFIRDDNILDLYNEVYSLYNIKEAIKESDKYGIAIVYPSDKSTMKTIYEEYTCMIQSDKELSDSISKKYFNLTNEENYNLLNSHDELISEAVSSEILKKNASDFAAKYLKKIYDEPISAIIESSLKFYNILESDSDKALIEDSVSRIFTNRDTELNNVIDTDTIYTDIPYFTAQKMIDLGVSSGYDDNIFNVPADNTLLEDGTTVEEWFNHYKNNQLNYFKEHNIARINTLRRLFSDFYEIKESGDINKINARKQSILELGWDPEVEFSDKNRALNDKKMKDLFTTSNRIIDMRDVKKDDLPEYFESNSGEKLYPIYVILISRKRFISNLIKYFTNSNISHAAISFDLNLKDVWSFNGDKYLFTKKSFGGLSNEPIETFEDHYIEVYCVFVKKEYYDNLKSALEHFKTHAKEYRYDYEALLKYIFDIDVDEKNKFVCSSFVDRMLQVAKVNLRDTKSKKLVSPEQLKVELGKSNKIFFLYNGNANNYKANEIKDLITMMSKKGQVFSESLIQESKIEYKNDKGEEVPKKCNKCGSDVKIYLRGEPVFLCNNKKCEKYYGTVPCRESSIDISYIDSSFFTESIHLDFSSKFNHKYAIFFIYRYGEMYLSLRSNLEYLYKFNNIENKGMLEQHKLSEFDPKDMIELYMCFVKEDRYNKIVDYINQACSPYYKFAYSQMNMMAKLMNIKYGSKTPGQLCMEMLDKVIRLSDAAYYDSNEFSKHFIGYDGMEDLANRKLDLDGRIYRTYFDTISNYSSSTIESIIASIAPDIKVINESFTKGNSFRSIFTSIDEEAVSIKKPSTYKYLLEQRNKY